MHLSILLHTLIDKIEKLTEALLLICKLLSLLTAASRGKKAALVRCLNASCGHTLM
ncbi:hypothetical protein FM120_28540 [Sphingobacterium faecium PCAi_F2.5]|nr:hypothetical protein FM120_28540 [Sphingobacterium faecium PCAi_F2.5]